jgi:hypothetical protein
MPHYSYNVHQAGALASHSAVPETSTIDPTLPWRAAAPH